MALLHPQLFDIYSWSHLCVLNPAVVLILTGLTICVVSFADYLAHYVIMSFCSNVFFAYIFLVISTFVLFMLFYSDTAEGISAHSVLLYSIKKYHTNRNVADFVDYLQEQLECCGTSSSAQGFKDWQLNEQFKCNQTNPYPEKCGVPFSCCRNQLCLKQLAQ
uniref:Tetraspanin n=1 Tax=Ditylenchus dipsaci TaxID=166011 RepID=A0A915DBT0_9BILA